MQEKRLVITIDGPAASGKSTTARNVAERLGYMYIDTGAMYRAVTLEVIRQKIDLHDEKGVAAIAASASIELRPGPFKLHLFLNGEDVTDEIRSAEVTRSVSAVSRIRSVREALVRIQRRLGRDGGVVLEGRDIGTVVFPRADLKIFMVAEIDARSRRRAAEMRERGEPSTEEQVAEDIRRRDELDSGRAVSPLVKAADAVELDTSELSIEEQVEFVVRKAKDILKKQGIQ